jgi:hypothetical protein
MFSFNKLYICYVLLFQRILESYLSSTQFLPLYSCIGIPPSTNQPLVFFPIDTYLPKPFPMFEHVGVSEEVLYGE